MVTSKNDKIRRYGEVAIECITGLWLVYITIMMLWVVGSYFQWNIVGLPLNSVGVLEVMPWAMYILGVITMIAFYSFAELIRTIKEKRRATDHGNKSKSSVS